MSINSVVSALQLLFVEPDLDQTPLNKECAFFITSVDQFSEWVRRSVIYFIVIVIVISTIIR